MTTVLALYDTLTAAQQATQDLVANGISRDRISLAATDASGDYRRYMATVEKESGEIQDATAVDAGVGAMWGGVGGLLLGLSLLLIPGLGPVVAGGPLVAALLSSGLGAGVGAVAGGLVGALVGMGVSEEEATHYAEGVRRGSILVTVKTTQADQARVTEIVQFYNPVNLEERMSRWQQAGLEQR